MVLTVVILTSGMLGNYFFIVADIGCKLTNHIPDAGARQRAKQHD